MEDSSLKIANGFQPLTIFAKSSIFDVWVNSEHASEACSLKACNLSNTE